MCHNWKDRSWSWGSNTLAIAWEEKTPWKRPWCWESVKARGEGDNRRQDGWTVSSKLPTWIRANSGRQWKTGGPGVLWSMGSQRVGHDLMTKQQQHVPQQKSPLIPSNFSRLWHFSPVYLNSLGLDGLILAHCIPSLCELELSDQLMALQWYSRFYTYYKYWAKSCCLGTQT